MPSSQDRTVEENAPSPAVKVAAARRSDPIRDYFAHSAAPLQAAVLTLPLLTVYGVGVLLVPEARNGVDFFTTLLRAAMASLAGSPRASGAGLTLYYLGFYGLLLCANVALVWWLGRKKTFNIRYFIPLLIECSIYAVVTGSVSASVTRNLTGILHMAIPPLAAGDAGQPHHYGLIAGLFISAGAGLHEELCFRLIGIGVVARLWLGKAWRSPSLRLVGLVLASSVLFSAVHHLVEPFTLTAFLFRAAAGMVFATLYLARGFAVAAWTHALYDVWVIVALGA